MSSLRLHLDDADETNGALKLLPGTHQLGRLKPEQIRNLRSTLPEVVCHARRGDALLMRPLILHASARSTTSRRLRILHIEFTGRDLPGALEWSLQA